MAITLEQEPQEHSPAYNELIYVASSDNTAEAGFQYVFDIYLGASFKTRHLIPARPENGLGVFDARKYIEQQVTSDMDETDTAVFILNSNSFREYQIKIGEKTDALGVVADLATSTNSFAWNGVFDFIDFVDYNEADYILLDATKPFLTNAPTEQNIELNQYLWMYSMIDTPALYDFLQVIRYDAAGSPLGTTNIANTIQASNQRFHRAIAGTQNLETQFGAGFFTNVASYTVQAVDNVFNPLSKLYTFTICSECRYPTQRIHFFNALGGYDAYNFTLVTDRDRSIVRKTVRTLTGEIDATTNSFVNTKRDRGVRVTHTTITEKLVVRSDWLTDAEVAWLQELVESPEIFIEDGDDLVALHPTKTSFRIEQHVYKQLFNLTVTFDFAVKNFRQRF